MGNEVKHTPGPWMIVKKTGDGKRIIIESDMARDNWNCLTCDVSSDDCDRDMALANAHLITAAPDLLAACQLAEAYCESQGMTDGMGTPSDEIKLVCALRAAVLKATTP